MNASSRYPTPASGGASGLVHVIENDASMLKSIVLLLRSAQVPVSAHFDARDFLDTLTPEVEAAAGCILADMHMPQLGGIELLLRLRSRRFRRPVIVMTAHSDVATAVRAMKAGAFDFLEKPFKNDALLSAITLARELPDAEPAAAPVSFVSTEDSASLDAAEKLAALSQRERDVLERLLVGRQNKAIALELGLSPRTVEVYRARLMARLGARNLAELVRLALRARGADWTLTSRTN
jgi:two-component system response regulator FixJ